MLRCVFSVGSHLVVLEQVPLVFLLLFLRVVHVLVVPVALHVVLLAAGVRRRSHLARLCFDTLPVCRNKVNG